MKLAVEFRSQHESLSALAPAARTILEAQRGDGAIPWFEAGPWDPWNHAECLMALSVMGEFEAAKRGFDYLEETQGADGAWLGEYGNALPMEGRLRIARVTAPAFRDLNFIAYPAVAVWHRLRLTGDAAEARQRFGMIERAIGFVLAHQQECGDFPWCAEAHGTEADDSLLAGNAAIHIALDCAIALASALDRPRPDWALGRARLRAAIRECPQRFGRNRSGACAFAMDWYYPVLAGLLTPLEARQRLEAGRDRFVRPGLGCHCVTGEPWVTVAESAELVLTLMRLGARDLAVHLLGWQEGHRDGDGAYWMGWQYDEQIPWPQEKPSWTQAAMILAHDAVQGASAASSVLTRAAV